MKSILLGILAALVFVVAIYLMSTPAKAWTCEEVRLAVQYLSQAQIDALAKRLNVSHAECMRGRACLPWSLRLKYRCP